MGAQNTPFACVAIAAAVAVGIVAATAIEAKRKDLEVQSGP
jgi:hypothetical protein